MVSSSSPIHLHPLVTPSLVTTITNHRRHLHTIPELAFEEKETSAYIKSILATLPNVQVIAPVGGETGVVAIVRGGRNRDLETPCIALRADMDGLPILEETQLEFKSTMHGRHHACGHDGHMAILLGVAIAVTTNPTLIDSLNGCLKFVFQPAEEGKGGARAMIEKGVLDGRVGPIVTAMYGLHLWNYLPHTYLGVTDGAMMGASDAFTIKIIGRGGHAAQPQGTADAIVAAGILVTQFQTIISRNVDPLQSAVITIGTIEGGEAYNAIAGCVTLTGTVRTQTIDVKHIIMTRMQHICDGTAISSDTTVTLEYRHGYPPVDNKYAQCTSVVRSAAIKIASESRIKKTVTLAAEDFAYYLLKVPGCFFFVGSAPDASYAGVGGAGDVVVDDGDNALLIPHHKSIFTINEHSLGVGASMFLHIIDTLQCGDSAMGHEIIKE